MTKNDHLVFLLRQITTAWRCWTSVILAFAGLWSAAQAAETLGEYNVDPSTVAVAGGSAGGFMAVQLGIAYSSLFPLGFAVWAGGPYDCARNNELRGECVHNFGQAPDIRQSVNNMRRWSGKEIDDVANIANQRIYIQHGTADTVVGVKSGEALYAQVLNFATSSNVVLELCPGGTHDGCPDSAKYYEYSWESWFYPDLRYPEDGNVYSGQLLEFDQTRFFGRNYSIGMGRSGFVYVPISCANGEPCKLLVKLHGGYGGYDLAGLEVIEYDKPEGWSVADANNLIILYPQGQGVWGWDFFGEYSNQWDQKKGPQVKAIAEMVQKITAGHESINPSDCLFTWAEENYPSLFSPPTANSQTLPPYYYRHYAATNSYLGTSSSDGNVYYLGPATEGEVRSVGSLSHWLSVSGCQ